MFSEREEGDTGPQVVASGPIPGMEFKIPNKGTLLFCIDLLFFIIKFLSLFCVVSAGISYPRILTKDCMVDTQNVCRLAGVQKWLLLIKFQQNKCGINIKVGIKKNKHRKDS